MTTSHHGARGPATRAWPDRAIAQLAARQHTIVTLAQLRALGVSPRTVQAAVARGRLHRVHVGVYSLVLEGARPPLAGPQAALLACGPGAAVSHRSAARLHGLRVAGAASAPIEITVTGDRRRPGLPVHRTERWSDGDLVRIQRLAVTSLARTVVDLAAELPERALEHLLDEALTRTGRTQVQAALDRRPLVHGSALLRRLLDPARPSSDTWSIAEERLLVLIRRAGLPAPEVNVPVGPYVPDLLWREQRVIVEFDSRAHHSGGFATARDARRHNELTTLGYTVLHVTWNELTRHPERVLVAIGVALSAGER